MGQHAVQHWRGQLGGAERRGTCIKGCLRLSHQCAQLQGREGVEQGIEAWSLVS